jgi:CheY-like chemotaxis protein
MAKTLLLADDSVTIQKVVGISLAGEDVNLVTVDNGDDAVAKAREVNPDVVLADVVMPGMSGYEVCEALKADPALRHIPVLLLTGTFEAFDEERAQRSGAAGHVAKPFEAQVLLERVREVLAAPPAPEPAPAPEPVAASTPVPIAQTPLETLAAPASGGESFDFFDDDFSAVTPPDRTPAISGETPGLDPSDGAFAFGDDDLGLAASEAPPELAPSPGPAPTIAILPDDADAGPADLAAPLEPHFDEPDPGTTADALLPAEMAAPAPAAVEESFDFEIGSADADALAPVGGEDFAQETVLDPNGASGFDVSSSDLGDPLSAGPGDAPPPLPFLEEGPALPVPEQNPAAPWAEPEPTPLAAEPPPAPLDDPIFAIGTEEAPPVEAVLDESALEQLVAPERAPYPEPEPAFEPQPEVEPERVIATHDPAALAGVALAEIEPRLREQLHDTLEKIAWESLGDVAEQIVRQAIERVERIAWEVIPELAETLIREEIRKMKGEAE